MKPPNLIDNATVLFWAWSGEAPFGHLASDDGTVRFEIYGLAICQYVEGEVYRFSCDKNWKTRQDGVYETVDDAMDQLPTQYKNVVAKWQMM